MCGIAGAVRVGQQGQEIAALGLNHLRHRGPDHLEVRDEGEASLGAVRLAIRDRSSSAHQPFALPGGRWIVTFNGELNNHQELRQRFGADHNWVTESDTETIAVALERQGWTVLKELRGMYAIAAWEIETSSLVLARDFPGIKPLYYAHTEDGGHLYASEFTAILAMMRALQQPLTVTRDTALEYLMYRDTLLQPETLVASIRKVEPGSIVRLQRDGRLEVEAADKLWLTHESANLDALEGYFVRAIQETIEVDQPMGMFVSGGVDSSTVLAELVHQGAQVEALTLRYEKTGEFSFSELPFSRFVCNTLNVPLHELTLTEERFLEVLPTAIGRQDGFSMDPTIVAYHELGRAAAEKGLRVVVTGTGSDEIFGSYEWLHTQSFAEFDEWMASSKTRSLLAVGQDEWTSAHAWSRERRQIRFEQFQHDGLSLADSIRMFGMFHLEADALPRVDLGTMGSSVEARVPLLDQAFVRLALSCSPDVNKEALRKLAIDRIPPEIQKRPKCGFPHPVFFWMKHGKLAGRVQELLMSDPLGDLVDKTAVESFFSDERSLLTSRPPLELYQTSSAMWYLYAFALWCDQNGIRVANRAATTSVR
ncbi:asparagine synthase (glutamine-hydrolyzing) [Tumebacillus lipolyticus]|uniref:asparagine synthase (glutamine-hydrolyzing) n=1 Tax=Tumebacillus lipolyticus TaxID=1280370 RepID=A0ABW4ZZI1_9BACL